MGQGQPHSKCLDESKCQTIYSAYESYMLESWATKTEVIAISAIQSPS